MNIISFFNFFKTFFPDKVQQNNNAEIEMPLESLAFYPLAAMLDEREPFSNWRPDGVEIPESFEQSFKMNVWIYQMWVFYLLFARRYNYEIANRALDFWAERLDKANIGVQLKHFVLRIHDNVEMQIKKPIYMDVGGEKTKMPLELGVALEFLTEKDGPFAMTDEEKAAGLVPAFNNMDVVLTTCLEHGKTKAIEKFDPLITSLKLKA